jgi:hypothetical protein
VTETDAEQMVPYSRLEADVKRAMAAGFAEGRKHQRELDALAFTNAPQLTQWCHRNHRMFIITNRGVEITSRMAADYLRAQKIGKDEDMPDRR